MDNQAAVAHEKNYLNGVALMNEPSSAGHQFYWRPNTEDFVVFEDVVDRNEYRLPPQFEASDIIIDIGAHIGSFSYAAALRGPGKIFAYEAHPVNHAIACKNLTRFGDLVSCQNLAVWQSDKPDETLYNEDISTYTATGGVSVLWNNEGLPVSTIGLDQVLSEVSNGFKDRIRFLKIDCEGAEYPILFTSKHLDIVDEISGEYHEIKPEDIPPRAKVNHEYDRFDSFALKDFLGRHGFTVQLEPRAENNGLFTARFNDMRLPLTSNDSEIDIAQLMARIREAAEKRKSNSLIDASATLYSLLKTRKDADLIAALPKTDDGNSTISQTDFTAGITRIGIPPIQLQPEFDSLEHYRANDLLVFHDHIFVRNAYRAILKREPDESGFARYLNSLRSGRLNKLDVLASLRFSPEGRLRNVKIDGLKPAYFRRLYRVPVLGYLLELAVGIVRLPVLIASYRALETYSAAQDERLAAHINEAVAVLTKSLDEITKSLDEITKSLDKIAKSQEETAGATRAHIDERIGAFRTQVTEVVNGISETQKKIADLYHQQIKALFREQRELTEDQNRLKSDITDHMKATESKANELAFGQELQTEKWLELKHYAEGELAQKLQRTRMELVLQERRLTLLLEEARRRLPERLERDQLDRMVVEKDHLLDWFYSSLEDQFRGTSEEIKGKLKFYLPILSGAGIETDILDLGCGRGEWLEVLKEAGLTARGIDLNRVMIEQCMQRGLEAFAAEAIPYLRGLADNSLNCVTAFHLAEHLPLEDLIRLFDEIIRTLRPGGLVILETPNPENLLVGSCNFYLDPTHRNPIPSETLRFLVESRGFCRLDVFKLHPVLLKKLKGTDELTQHFNEYFFGPQDYAVVGRKP